jgi:glycosyltransferase involved in cell wall biosynthesis
MRLGVFSDPVLYARGDEITADRAYLRFVLGLADRVDELVVFGRVHPTAQDKPYRIAPRSGVRVSALPYYPSISDVRAVMQSWRGSRSTFAHELDRLDAVWLFAPNPLSLEFARIARRRGVPVGLAIRQDFPEYVGHRYPRRPDARLAGHALERAFRRLSRVCPTVVVGEELEQSYARAPALLSITVSQVSIADIVDADDAVARPWNGPRRLLSVGRLDREKNPVLLAEVLARLRARDEAWTLEVVGEGPAHGALARRADELGVAHALSFSGYVPAGEALWERFRSSHAFLHVSLTEGMPSVLLEAQAAGTPVVASDVGGVGSLIRQGKTGLLISPDDAPAAVEALELLGQDPDLRRAIVREALADVKTRTSEIELDRVHEFLERNLSSRSGRKTTLVTR